MEDPNNNKKSNTRKYHPYQHLQLETPLKNLYDLPTSPELLFPEQGALERRSFTESLTFYTGVSYLSGAVLGGVKGTFEGLGSAEMGDTFKLRVNRVLNSGGALGRRWGNKLGVVGLIYAGMEGIVVNQIGTDDLASTVIAGLGTGALYRAASGPRSAVIAGAIGGIVAAAATAGKHVVKRYVPI